MTTVKIVFRGDIRRVIVTDFASLLVHVADAYKIEDFVIKYTDDDGDRVSVASAEGFAEAVKSAKGKTLKLLIFLPKGQHDRKENNAPCNEEVEEDSKAEDSKAPSPSAPPLPVKEPLDHGVDCQGCAKRIIGTMYRCTVCPSVCVCYECEEKGVHNINHTLLKVRVPFSDKRARKGKHVMAEENACKQDGKQKCKLNKFRRLLFPCIFIAILRSLPVSLCFAGIWAIHQIIKKKSAHLKKCSECTHKEGCRVGKKATRLTKGEKCQGLIPKILFVIFCLVLRALPLWFLVLCTPFAFVFCRILCRLKRGIVGGCRNGFRADSIENYRDIFQLNCAQLFQRVQQNTQQRHPRGLPKSVVGCAAVAASESLAASVAAVVALGESVAAEFGAQIPIAMPVRTPPYSQQIQTLKEMGFEDTPLLQQLLTKHAGNIPAVISDVMQLKSNQ